MGQVILNKFAKNIFGEAVQNKCWSL